MSFLPKKFTPMNPTRSAGADAAATVQAGDILCSNSGPFGHSGIVFEDPDASNPYQALCVAHMVNSGMKTGGGQLFPDQTMVFRHVEAGDGLFGQRVGLVIKGFRHSPPGYRLIGATRSLGSTAFGKEAHARINKYMARPNQKPKKMFCSEMVVNVVQLAEGANRNSAFFIDLDALKTWPSTLRKWLQNAQRWVFVGGWTRNPAAFRGG